jgi:hypothetical protein
MKGNLRLCAFVGTAVLFAVMTIGSENKAFAERNTGGDYPNEKCQRNNKDGTVTIGQCSNVCSGLVVNGRDVNSGLRTCSAARLLPGWNLIPGGGNTSVAFWRYNSTGELQACGSGSNVDEIECRPVTIHEVKTSTSAQK